jgi:hypothetical protein
MFAFFAKVGRVAHPPPKFAFALTHVIPNIVTLSDIASSLAKKQRVEGPLPQSQIKHQPCLEFARIAEIIGTGSLIGEAINGAFLERNTEEA